MSATRLVRLCAVALPLVACGGGSGGGASPTHNPIPQHIAYVANTGDNTVSAYAIDPTTGSLSPLRGSPFKIGSGVIGIAIAPGRNFAYVTVAGGLSAYSIDPSTGDLHLVASSPFPTGVGAGPPIVDPTGRFVYTMNGTSNNVSAFSIDAMSGSLTTVPGSPFSTGQGPSAAGFDPSGGYLYVVTAYDILGYSIDPTTGALNSLATNPFALQGGQSIAIDPSGRYALVAVYNPMQAMLIESIDSTHSMAQAGTTPAIGAIGSTFARDGRFFYAALLPTLANPLGPGYVQAYSFNATTGQYSMIQQLGSAGAPCCIAIDPTGRFLYVANDATSNISAYSIDTATGVLAPVPGSPFASGMTPQSMAIR